MQWSMPRPEIPWPHDMMIRVNDGPNHLALLLFVRQAWSLANDMGIPQLEPEPDFGDSQLPAPAHAAIWDKRWKKAWNQASSWYEIEEPTHHPTPAELRESQDPSQGLNPFVPPFWTQQYEWERLPRLGTVTP
jgi:hypothetical protein